MTTLQHKKKEIIDLKAKCYNIEARYSNDKELREEEIAGLHREIGRLTALISSFQHYIANLEKKCRSLSVEKSEMVKIMKQLNEIIAEQTDLIAALQGRLTKNSSNSSKPSSTDGFKKVIHNSREVSGKKPGGQFGHKGYGLFINANLKNLIESGKVNVEIVDHGNPELDYVPKYELDVRMAVVVIEHRFHNGEAIPENFQNPVNYGIDIKALCAYLSTEGLMSAQRVSEFVKAMTDDALTPSKATILAFQGQMSEQLDGEFDAIRESILTSDVMNVDETPIKCTERPTKDGESIDTAIGTTYNLCVRTYSTKDTVFLTLNPRKDDVGVKADGVLTAYAGKLVHDHDKKYYKYGTIEQGECNVHVGRYLKEIDELTKHEWAMKMGTLLLDILKHKQSDIGKNIFVMDDESFNSYSDEYDVILQIGKKEIEELSPKSIIRKTEQNLLKRLEKYKYNHLLFAKNYSVCFSNNEAERDFRWVKTHQKVSGCHRSYQGAKTMVRLMSFTRTLKKRKLPILDGIKSVLDRIPVLSKD